MGRGSRVRRSNWPTVSSELRNPGIWQHWRWIAQEWRMADKRTPRYLDYAGVAVAVVTQNRDPDGLARVTVRFPWYENPNENYWARLAVPMAGQGQGTYFLPEIGQEVLVAFDRGDVRFPYVVGALWNGKEGPPTTNSDGKKDRRVIPPREGHWLLFDDGSKGLVELKLQDGKRLPTDEQGHPPATA